MSLSAALSIFASPSGLAPVGGEGVSGQDGLFAGLIEAEATADVAVRATTAGRAAADPEVKASPPDAPEALVASSAEGSPMPQVVLAAPLVALAASSVETGPAASPSAGLPHIATPSTVIRAPSPRPDGSEPNRETGQSAARIPVEIASPAAVLAGPDAVSRALPPQPVATLASAPKIQTSTEPDETIGRPASVRATQEAAAPLPVSEPSSPAIDRSSGLADRAIGVAARVSARPGGDPDIVPVIDSGEAIAKVDRSGPVDPLKPAAVLADAAQTRRHATGHERQATQTVAVGPSGTVEAGKPTKITVPAADLASPGPLGSTEARQPVGQGRDPVAGSALVGDKGASVAPVEDAATTGPIDAAVVRAVRVRPSPTPVAQPHVAPALAPVLQGGGNAPAASIDDAGSEALPVAGSDHGAGEAKAPSVAAAAATVAPAVTRPPAEAAPPILAENSTAPDTLALDGRVETPPETEPAASAAVTASGLSRSSIETTALLSAQIARRLEGRSTRFDMALTPEGLGRVDVRVEIDADGQLAARLAFDNPAAATELRGRADELRRQLEDAGFTLSRDALDFSDRESSPGGQGAFERQQRRAAYAHRLSTEPDLGAVPAAWSPHPSTPRGVDVKV